MSRKGVYNRPIWANSLEAAYVHEGLFATFVFRVEAFEVDSERWIAKVLNMTDVLAYGKTREDALRAVTVLALRTMADRIESEAKDATPEPTPHAPEDATPRTPEGQAFFDALGVIYGPEGKGVLRTPSNPGEGGEVDSYTRPIRVMACIALDNYRLALEFSDGLRGIANLSEYVKRAPFEKLVDADVFGSARVEAGTIEWPGCAVGIAVEALYLLVAKGER